MEPSDLRQWRRYYGGPDAPSGRFSTMPSQQYVLHIACGKAAASVLRAPDFTLGGVDAKYCRRPVLRLAGLRVS